MPTITEINQELFNLSHRLLEAVTALEKAGVEWSYRENDYRKAKATAYLEAEGKTVDHKKAEVDLRCENERLAAHLAESAKEAAVERVRAIRASLSALQSVATGTRVELETLNTQDNLSQQDQVTIDPSDFPF